MVWPAASGRLPGEKCVDAAVGEVLVGLVVDVEDAASRQSALTARSADSG